MAETPPVQHAPDADADNDALPRAATPSPVVELDARTLERWLRRTKKLPVDAAAAIAESLSPADGAVDGSLYAGPSPIAGRGLFSSRSYAVDEVITICPLLRIPHRVIDAFADTTVYGHCFDLGDDLYGYPMGLATLLNHTASPSARCEVDVDGGELWVHAARTIPAGEEITIDYTGGDAGHELWFDL